MSGTFHDPYPVAYWKIQQEMHGVPVVVQIRHAVAEIVASQVLNLQDAPLAIMLVAVAAGKRLNWRKIWASVWRRAR